MPGILGLLAAKGAAAGAVTPTGLTTRGGLDVIALMLLVGWLYRRRRAAVEMPLVLTTLNIGLFAAMAAISAGKFPAGVGFGLFGMLSLVRLRSAAFTLRDVAYTFVALVLALCTGLAQRETWLVAALAAALLLAVLVVDNPRAAAPVRTVKITLDRIYSVPGEIHADVAARFGREPLVVLVDEVDYVRETTRVSARFAVAPADGTDGAGMPEAGDAVGDEATASGTFAKDAVAVSEQVGV